MISDVTLGVVAQSMTDLIESGGRIAKRAQSFSDVATRQDLAENSNHATGISQSDMGDAISELAALVARYQVLGKLASGHLACYSIIANDGRG